MIATEFAIDHARTHAGRGPAVIKDFEGSRTRR
jgi:hypothetical protein